MLSPELPHSFGFFGREHAGGYVRQGYRLAIGGMVRQNSPGSPRPRSGGVATSDHLFHPLHNINDPNGPVNDFPNRG